MNDSVTAPGSSVAIDDPVAKQPAADSKAPTDTSAKRSRYRWLAALGLVVVLGGGGYGAYWFAYARYLESTDDSYVNGDVVDVTSEVPGTVIGLHVDDTQFVTREQPLLELDPADASIALRHAEANLGRAVRTVRARFAEADQLRAEIVDREVAVHRAERDYQRRTGLLSDGAVSQEELLHTKDDMTGMRAALAAARERLNGTRALIEGTTVANNPEVVAAAATFRDAWLASRRARITAPVSGVIARRSVQVGQRVAAGTPLMGLVPLDAVWIDANFKEVQLRDMRVGQPVTLRADVYGGKVVYHGRIVGLSAGSGSAFAVLPAQNASGNWIKIVQRVPVRVELDANELRAHPLRIGLSVSAEVDIRDTSGSLVARQVRQVPIPAQPSLGEDAAADARIAQVIEENAGAKRDRLTANWGSH